MRIKQAKINPNVRVISGVGERKKEKAGWFNLLVIRHTDTGERPRRQG